jgi:CRP/FNR family transcriptional regulator, cyclic AMP receptor protein
MLEHGSFFGESCLAGHLLHLATATAFGDATLVRIDKEAMIRVLHDEPAFAELFMTYLLAHNIRIQEDLVDQLFNSSEKRLARVLLLLAHFGKEGKPEAVIPKISQETLAEMIGTTRSRVSFFMNKFKKLGFLDYNGGLHVHSSLLNIVLHD